MMLMYRRRVNSPQPLLMHPILGYLSFVVSSCVCVCVCAVGGAREFLCLLVVEVDDC